jgi:release factor glutamine methyltransferase
LAAVREILSQNQRWVQEDRVGSESEQLVVAAYRKETDEALSRLALFSRMSDTFPDGQVEHLLEMARRRALGIPLQYILGYQSFWNHEYRVESGVLIPRPETEVLLQTAISVLSLDAPPSLGLEVGLGSGILSIELLNHFQSLRMVASEISDTAIQVARDNAREILSESQAGDRLAIVQPESVRDLWTAFQVAPQAADFLISNPPYLKAGLETDGSAQTEVDPDVIAHEPHEALFAPPGEPLFFYQGIVEMAPRLLKSEGYVFLEMPHERSSEIHGLFLSRGWDVRTVKDLTGRDRVLVARKVTV